MNDVLRKYGQLDMNSLIANHCFLIDDLHDVMNMFENFNYLIPVWRGKLDARYIETHEEDPLWLTYRFGFLNLRTTWCCRWYWVPYRSTGSTKVRVARFAFKASFSRRGMLVNCLSLSRLLFANRSLIIVVNHGETTALYLSSSRRGVFRFCSSTSVSAKRGASSTKWEHAVVEFGSWYALRSPFHASTLSVFNQGWCCLHYGLVHGWGTQEEGGHEGTTMFRVTKVCNGRKLAASQKGTARLTSYMIFPFRYSAG